MNNLPGVTRPAGASERTPELSPLSVSMHTEGLDHLSAVSTFLDHGPFQKSSFFLKIILLVFWLCQPLVASSGPSVAAARRGCASVAVCRLLLWQRMGSTGRDLSSCGPRVSLLSGIGDLLGLGIKPVSAELARGIFTTEPPGRSPPNPMKALASLPSAQNSADRLMGVRGPCEAGL